MNILEITSLPEILFSHIYRADNYYNSCVLRDNFLEVFYIEKGEAEMRIKNEMFHAQKGDVICHTFNSEASFNAENFHCHHTVGATVNTIPSYDGQGLLLPTLTPNEYNTSGICSLIDDFVHNQMLYKSSKALGAAKFLELLCAIDKCNRKAQNGNLPSELLYTNKAKKYIQKNINSPITQNSVAEHLGISPEYLCAVFKKSEGVTMMRYINKLKLENIKSLMDNTNVHLYEAAAIYGYSDPNYVSRLFKQLFGYNITDKPNIFP